MPAGPLDRRVQLLAPSVARDPDYGSETITYAVAATVWGRVQERSGGEAVLADQRVMTRDITVRIRYRSDVLSTWRCAVGARKFSIAGAPLEVGRRQYLDLPCQEYSDA
jgi:SPP1 family predicted phage head-tail adaptor